MNDETVHTVQLVGQSENDIDTGYYIDIGTETYPIMKSGTPTFYVRIDGVIYDIRSREIYEGLRDEANVFVNQYMRENN